MQINPVVTPRMIEAARAVADGVDDTAFERIYLAMTQASPPPDEPTQPKLEKIMRQAAFASTEHRYDLTPPDEMVERVARALALEAKALWPQDATRYRRYARAALQSIGPLMREKDGLEQRLAEAIQKARDECGGDPISFAYAEAAMRSALKSIGIEEQG